MKIPTAPFCFLTGIALLACTGCETLVDIHDGYNPVQADAQRHEAEQAQRKAALDSYEKAKISLQYCVPIYVLRHRKSNLTATELTDAGLSACHPFIAEMERQLSHGLTDLNSTNALQDAVDAARGAGLRALAESDTEAAVERLCQSMPAGSQADPSSSICSSESL